MRSVLGQLEKAGFADVESEVTLFHLALSMTLEGGPEPRVPLSQRLTAAAPGRTSREIDMAVLAARDAREFAYKVGCDVCDKVITDDDALMEIRRRYPSLDDALALRLRSHGYYSAMM